MRRQRQSIQQRPMRSLPRYRKIAERPIGRLFRLSVCDAQQHDALRKDQIFCCREAGRMFIGIIDACNQLQPLRTSIAGHGSAVRRNRRDFVLPMTMLRSCGCSRATASCDRPISQHSSAVRSIASTIGFRGFITPAILTGRGRNWTIIRAPDRPRWCTRSPTGAPGF